MTASESPSSDRPGSENSEGPVGGSDSPDERISTLRGASVDADIRRVAHLLIGACLVALAVLIILLFMAGAHKNAQITRLRQHGVPVQVTVSRCLGQLGGSGSNRAGYSCKGTFTLDGHRFTESIPGSTLYPPGTTIRGIAVPGDPALLAPVHVVAAERASWRVFILPTVLLVILVALVGALVLRRRAIRRAR
jgi:heme A synthase